MSEDELRRQLREKARADVAERECAELHDALDKARGLIDDAGEALDKARLKIRERDQAAGWAQAAATVEAARRG